MAAQDNKTDAVTVERHDDVALVRLNRPRSRNALGPDIKAGLEAAIPTLMDDSAVRCLVITGSEEAFCAGGDINNMNDRGAPSVRARMYQTYAWSQRILTGEKPVVAAVNGAAAGAGFSLALLCDIAIVADNAYFRAAFPGLGAVPDLGLALTLPRSIGSARAKDILLTNRRIEAAEAVAIGIAKRVVPAAALLADAMQLASELAAGPATSFGLTKMLLNNAYGPINDFFATEAMAQAVAFGSKEFAEGVNAFHAKRKPDFRNNR
ncbi:MULTISPECIES: enoyl-CoA hydratase/isomerase family protein [Bradyrhizobium]|uniref:Enoyl-CoA hydratase n=2 Tax=Bradyrhizobium TaxID=374 RepID=A0ABY0Q012_9BRAD|nr:MULTISPECIES: enoyl-CoA hydratase-related protein [Bradyrhizobium]SDJ26889.1 Enoyl-CoA hydratase [Bradyrhizobium ottawaense]SEC74985.1 Enoyl-CoA hydratase [Bradyrhizobium lablabi]SHK87631.1 Enoyl-CoA hydratase [Bradyrhizobium lablabi]